jgi:hypothetical protein
MLSVRRYGWLCVFGGEVAYIICLLGGYLPFEAQEVTTDWCRLVNTSDDCPATTRGL